MPTEATTRIEFGDVSMEVDTVGDGPDLVVLHGDAGPRSARALVEDLREEFTVHLPHLPGWGGTVAPDHVRTIKDVADVVGEYLRRFDALPPLVGVSIGGWVAARVASVLHQQPPALVLVSPVGLKLRGRADRDYVDLYPIGRTERLSVLYGSPPTVTELAMLSADDFVDIARAEEALARYCWAPYMHDPSTRYDLRRIESPTLVIHGEADRFVLAPDYYREYATLIGDNATVAPIAGAGHRVDEERHAAVAASISEFIGSRVALGV